MGERYRSLTTARAYLSFFAILVHVAYAAKPVEFLTPESVVSDDSGHYVVSYTMNVTLSYGAPSCFARPIVLVSGIFEPGIAINQFDTLRITLINSIPASFPTLMDGIAIHWHGWRMFGPAQWFDGPGYIELCPLQAGKSYTFQFQVNETPGTYFWHDHVGGFKGDGLKGPLVVYPPRAPLTSPSATPDWPPKALPDLWSYDEERVIFLSDWYHAPTSTLLMRLNAPVNPAFVTNNTGAYLWLGNPQALLINGNGFYGDCELPGNDGYTTEPLPCSPQTFTVPPGRTPQQPWASTNNPGCTHSEITVEAGKTYRMRLINAALMVYLTTCFGGHTVTVIAADGVPVKPYKASCLDINAGQRLDVLLTADQPANTYWISTVCNIDARMGTPGGYAVLRYTTSSVPSGTFPAAPAPKPAEIQLQYTSDYLVMYPELLKNASKQSVAARRYTFDTSNAEGSLAPPKTANKLMVFNTTPIDFSDSGLTGYGVGNVATPQTPPCKSLLWTLRKDPKYLDRMAVTSPSGTGTGPNWGVAELNASDPFPVYKDGISPVPSNPAIGLHVVPIKMGDVVDVVINNADMFLEIHPFHLHGHRFWVLGRGNGTFDPAKDYAGLNLANPQYRDTVAVYNYGWVYFRFVSDNPGIWPLHCHIVPHQWQGQALYFLADVAKSSPPPKSYPVCPKTCRYQFAPYTKSWMQAKWGASGYEVPPLY